MHITFIKGIVGLVTFSKSTKFPIAQYTTLLCSLSLYLLTRECLENISRNFLDNPFFPFSKQHSMASIIALKVLLHEQSVDVYTYM